MRARLIALRERRTQLTERARGERERLAALLAQADAVSAWIDLGRRMLDEAKRRPLAVAVGAALLFALRPKRALKWLASGWSLWQLYRRARRWWLRFAPAAEAPARPGT